MKIEVSRIKVPKGYSARRIADLESCSGMSVAEFRRMKAGHIREDGRIFRKPQKEIAREIRELYAPCLRHPFRPAR
jgi:hypothetical protein